MEEQKTTRERRFNEAALDVSFPEFIEALSDMYGTIDSDDDKSIQEFAENEAQAFGIQKGLSTVEVQGLIQEIINHYKEVREGERVQSEKRQREQERNGKKNRDMLPDKKVGVLTESKIQENITDNIRPAIFNYIKFVLPYSQEMQGEGYDEERYQKELGMFRDFQKKYLIEDTSLKNPKDNEYGYSLLEKAVLENERKYRKEVRDGIIREQKESAKKYIDEIVDLFEQNDPSINNEHNFWTDYEKKIRTGLRMSDLDKDKVVLAVRKFSKEVLEAKAKKAENNTGAEIEKESGDVVAQQKLQVIEARDSYARVSATMDGAAEKIEKGGLSIKSLPTQEVEEAKSDLEKMKERFKVSYRKALDQKGVENVEQEMKKVDVAQGVADFDAKTNAVAEKRGFGKLFSHISEKARSFVKNGKKKAIALFVAIAVLTPAMLQKEIVSNIDTKDKKTSIGSMTMKASPQIDLSNNTISAETVAALSAENDNGPDEKGKIISKRNVAISEKEIEKSRVVKDTFVVAKGGSIEKALSLGLQKHAEQVISENPDADFDLGDSIDVQKWAQAQAHVLAQKFAQDNSGINIDHVKLGTKVYLDLSDASNMSIDVAFEGGPHIVPENEKKMNEISYIKEQMKRSDFQKAVTKNIKKVFDAKDMGALKKIAKTKVMKIMESKDETMKGRLTKIMTNAHEMYGEKGMPRENASVQNYFIRLYARAERDGYVDQIFE